MITAQRFSEKRITGGRLLEKSISNPVKVLGMGTLARGRVVAMDAPAATIATAIKGKGKVNATN